MTAVSGGCAGFPLCPSGNDALDAENAFARNFHTLFFAVVTQAVYSVNALFIRR
jgi:hypothetical protein